MIYRWDSRDMFSTEWFSRLSSFHIKEMFPKVPFPQASTFSLTHLPVRLDHYLTRTISVVATPRTNIHPSRDIAVCFLPFSFHNYWRVVRSFREDTTNRFFSSGYVWSEEATDVIFAWFRKMVDGKNERRIICEWNDLIELAHGHYKTSLSFIFIELIGHLIAKHPRSQISSFCWLLQ